jgi:hypothetical protein
MCQIKSGKRKDRPKGFLEIFPNKKFNLILLSKIFFFAKEI